MRWLVEFIFPRRLHRIAFLLRVLLAATAENMLWVTGGPTYSLFFWGSYIALLIYELFFIDLPRAHDMEINGWWLLLLFVPGPNIVMGLILLLRAPVFLHLQGEPIRGGEQPADLSVVALDQAYPWLSSPQK